MERKPIIIGGKYGKLTVIAKVPGCKNLKRRAKYLCKCDCGNETHKDDKFLNNRVDITCGCHLVKNKTTKVCPMCGIDKQKSDYYPLSTKSGGIQSKCIECTSRYINNRYWSNHDEELAKMTKSRLKPINVKQRKEYYKKNAAAYKNTYLKIKADPELKKKRKEQADKYRNANKEKAKLQKKIYHNELGGREKKRIRHTVRYKTDIEYNLSKKLRFRLKNAVKAMKIDKCHSKSAIKLLGCDLTFFRNHIESKFTEGMTWELFVNAEIHLDHVKPVAKFNLLDIDEQKKCFHFSNLQPLWKLDNIKKGAKYIEPTS